MLLICGISFTLCSAVYIAVSNCLFGWECTKTSIQMIYSVVTLAAVDMGGLQKLVALGSLLSLLAAVEIPLFACLTVRSYCARRVR